MPRHRRAEQIEPADIVTPAQTGEIALRNPTPPMRARTPAVRFHCWSL
jgi:hypothetical protein